MFFFQVMRKTKHMLPRLLWHGFLTGIILDCNHSPLEHLASKDKSGQVMNVHLWPNPSHGLQHRS